MKLSMYDCRHLSIWVFIGNTLLLPSFPGRLEAASLFTFKFVKEAKKMIYTPPEKIICLLWRVPIFSDNSYVAFHWGLPDTSQFDGQQHMLLILDDLM
jgi:hypothetical protein